ncbi:unnamed protein product [Cochlearia groenlandica]
MVHETWFRVLETALLDDPTRRISPPEKLSKELGRTSGVGGYGCGLQVKDGAADGGEERKAEVKTQVLLRQNQSRVRLRQNRSHKCKRDQGIVRTSLVHQDDDLSCDEGRRQAAEVTSSLSYRCKGKRKKTVAKRAVGQSHMYALRARVSNLS